MAAQYTLGLDIGSSSIKAVVLSHSGNSKPRLVSLGSTASPAPGLVSDADLDLEAVAKSIRSLLDSMKVSVSEVKLALPESKIFSRVIGDLPYLSDSELQSTIRYSAEEFVPLPLDQVNLNWVIIGRSKDNKQTQVFVVASPKILVEKYLKVLKMAKLKPILMETEVIASARALSGDENYTPTTLLVQMGAATTDYAVVSNGVILLTRSIATGGTAFTRAISQYLNFEVIQAEEYKKVYGMLEDQLSGKIYQVLKPLVDVTVSEANRVIQAFQVKNPQNRIKRIVLTGGGAKLPGVVVYFANSLGLEVQEADPWINVDKSQFSSAKITEDAPLYAVAVGLALKG
jgi:type IV pilus assembly protein PilM